MDWVQTKDIFGWIGDKFGLVTQKVLVFLAEYGVKLTALQAKILDLAIVLLFLFVLIKFVDITSKVAKFIIFALLLILGASLIISFI